MLFRRKGKLRKEFDEKLLEDIGTMKVNWFNHKSLIETSYDPSFDAISQAKLSELKYYYLFKEARKRKIKIK